MIGRREAIGIGAVAIAAAMPTAASACTIIPIKKKQIRKRKAAGMAAVKKFVPALAREDKAQIVSVMGDGPWTFHGKRVERSSDPEAVFALAKNAVPGAYIRSLSDITHIDGKTFASVEVWDPSEADDDCTGGDRLVFLAFGVTRSGEIYSVDLING